MVNFAPNSSRSRGRVTRPTMVNVVKNATAGTMLMPASTKDPTSGKATKAGIKVMLPKVAETTVDMKVFDLLASSLIVSGGMKVSISPIRKSIPMISPNMFPIIPLAIFIEPRVLSLSLTIDMINAIIVIIQSDFVNISTKFPLSFFYVLYYNSCNSNIQ